MKKISLKNEKICHEGSISIGRFCFWSDVTGKALEKIDLSQRLTTAVIGTCVWAGVDNAWEQEKLEARKMPVNRADWASELQASIAQPKRVSAGPPTRRVLA